MFSVLTVFAGSSFKSFALLNKCFPQNLVLPSFGMDYGVNFNDKPCTSFVSKNIFYELPFLWTAFRAFLLRFTLRV